MRKWDYCLCENKGAVQLRSNCEADQHLCFRYMDSTIPVLLKSDFTSFLAQWIQLKISVSPWFLKARIQNIFHRFKIDIKVKTLKHNILKHSKIELLKNIFLKFKSPTREWATNQL